MSLSASSGLFVGREAELDEIARLLSDPACRLLTLVGLGGTGKTRLALEAARQLPDTRFVPLQPLTSPDFIVAAIADAVGFQFYSGSDPKQQLLDYLREKFLLLVLDNFEHLLDGATLLSDILASAPDIRLLVTARERLNLTEEWTFDVGGMEEESAVALFVQHARRAKVSFALTDDNRAAVARICRLVGGMPLALELAASWVRTLSCEAIADEIARGLDILETPVRNVEPRHRTMRAAFEPTWARLTDHERDVFMRLSVFRGGFTREAAKEVAGASLRTLSALVDKSLVRVDASGRYDLHELLRQYAAEKLGEAGEAKAASQIHADYFLKFAEGLNAVMGTQSTSWWERLELELPNFRAALTWSQTEASGEIGLRLTLALFDLWRLRGHLLEGIHWFAEMLAHFDAHISPISLTNQQRRLRAQALDNLGLLYAWNGNLDAARQPNEESVALFRELDDPAALADVLGDYGMLFVLRGDTESAAPVLQESLTLWRKIGNKYGITQTLFFLGNLAYVEGNSGQARAFWEESLAGKRENGETWMITSVLGNLSMAELDQAHDEQAKEHLTENLIMLQDMGDKSQIIQTLEVFARLLVEWNGTNDMQSLSQAARLFGAMEALRETTHERRMEFQRRSYERAIALLNTRLDGTRLSAAWAEGRAITLEQAAAYALETTAAIIEAQSDQQTNKPQTARMELLNSREIEVLCLIADGLTNGEIADQLFLAQSTIKWYVRQIFSKLDAASRTQAVARARTLRLLS